MSETTVLLVDDDRTILQALREQLRALFGSRLACETAESAEEAWEVLAELQEGGGLGPEPQAERGVGETRVILIVSDWLMPEVKGDVFLGEVRERYPGIVRVMLTGQADASVLEKVRSQGIVHALMFKPWTRAELEDAVRMALKE